MSDKDNAGIESTVSNSELIEQLGVTWQTAGITTLEPFVMKSNDWLFCVVAADMDKNIVRLNCEAIGAGLIYWVGTLEQLFTEFYRP